MTKKLHNTGNAEQVKQQQKLAENREKDKADALRLLLSSKGGRDFIWDLMAESFVFKMSFTGNNTTFFNEGMRNVGNKIMAMMMAADKNAFMKMHRENNDE